MKKQNANHNTREIIRLWEDYAKRYNSLSNKLQKAGIDPKELSSVIAAAIELYKNKAVS